MALAVSSPQNAFAKLEELQAKAKEIEQKFQHEKERIDAERSQLLGNIVAEIKMTADSLTTQFVPTAPLKATKVPVLPKKTNGNGHSSVQSVQHTGKRGRPKGSKNRPKDETKVAMASVAKTTDEEASGMDLKDAIMHVLNHPNLWQHVQNLPPQVNGLKVGEIYQVIEAEKLWNTKSKTPEVQISQRIKDLRISNKVIRGDSMRYRAV